MPNTAQLQRVFSTSRPMVIFLSLCFSLALLSACDDDGGDNGVILTPVENQIVLGEKAPTIRLSNPAGVSVNLDQHLGKVILVDFWGSWCAPCRAEMDDLRELYAKHKDSGLEIFGIAVGDRFDAWDKMISDSALVWTQAFDPTGSTGERFGYGGRVPYKVLIDRDGNVLDTNLSRFGLDARIEAVLE